MCVEGANFCSNIHTFVYALLNNSIQAELVECPTEQQLSVADSFFILKVGTISTRCSISCYYLLLSLILEQPVEMGPY